MSVSPVQLQTVQTGESLKCGPARSRPSERGRAGPGRILCLSVRDYLGRAWPGFRPDPSHILTQAMQHNTTQPTFLVINDASVSKRHNMTRGKLTKSPMLLLYFATAMKIFEIHAPECGPQTPAPKIPSRTSAPCIRVIGYLSGDRYVRGQMCYLQGRSYYFRSFSLCA